MRRYKFLIVVSIASLVAVSLGLIAVITGDFQGQVAKQELCLIDNETGSLPEGCPDEGVIGDDKKQEPNPCELVLADQSMTSQQIESNTDCVCYDDEDFPPAHDAVTETAHQAGVQKAEGDSKNELDKLLKNFADEVDSQYFYPLRRLLRIIDGRDVNSEEAKQILDAFINGLTLQFYDPVNYAKIQMRVLDPVTILEKAVYEALTLPKKDKHQKSDLHDVSAPRGWELLTNFRPLFEGWPQNLRFNGIKFDVLNVTSSNGQYSLCIPGGIGTANGGWGFKIEGINAKARLVGGPNSGLELTVSFDGRGQARAALYGSFRF